MKIDDVDYSNPTLNAQVEIALSRRRLDFYAPYPKQREFHAASRDLTKTEVLLMAGNQLGKFLRNGTPVLTPTGWCAIENLKVGDRVIAGDGTPTEVTGVYPQGVMPLYRFTFDRGETIDAGLEHQWVYQRPADRYPTRHSHGKVEPVPTYGQWTVGTTEDILKCSGEHPTPRRRVVMPVVPAVELDPQSITVDPYMLGVLLGDGGLSVGTIQFTTADEEIVESMKHACQGWACEVRSGVKYQYAVRGSAQGKNPLLTALRALGPGVMGCRSWEKSIPATYLWNTPSVRLAVLQGLMDTDGSISTDGAMEYSTTSPMLAEQVKFLVESFGGKVGNPQGTRCNTYTHKGEVKRGRPSYRLRIRLPQVCPFRLTRKIARLVRPVSTCDYRVLHSVVPCEPGPATCISVAHPSHTYVIEHCIVTHNTLAAAAQTAIFATGQYPSWWEGRRWDRPTSGWVAGPTGQSTRDAPQKLLLGESNEWGTGMIPGRNIIEIKKSAHGVPDAVESVTILHEPTGKTSRILFKTYDQGRLRWQGATIDYVWFDEEPPEDIYSEGCTRCQVLGGFVFLTFTPLLGMSEVVSRFLQQRPENSIIVKMGINDALHYTAAQRAAILARYPEHEREARAYGNPVMGSGRVFPLPWQFIAETPIQIPAYWRRLVGLDFGWDHYTAAVWLAFDPDTDTIHITDTYQLREQTPVVHAAAIKARGVWIPVAWPFDGLTHDPGSGKILADLYRQQGVNMLPTHATHPPLQGKKEGTSGYSTEAGILDMIDRMQTGRLKVFSTLSNFRDEYDVYYRKEGLIVKKGDDIMSAARVGCMAIRHAETRMIPRSEAPLAAYVPSDPGMGSLG